MGGGRWNLGSYLAVRFLFFFFDNFQFCDGLISAHPFKNHDNDLIFIDIYDFWYVKGFLKIKIYVVKH